MHRLKVRTVETQGPDYEHHGGLLEVLVTGARLRNGNLLGLQGGFGSTIDRQHH